MEPNRAPQAKRPSRKADLAHWIEQHQPAQIAEAEFAQILAALAPISSSYLRRLLRDCGVPLSPLVEGVRQDTQESLESSLLAMLAEYEAADRARRAAIRKLVIQAKDHARWAATRHPEKEEVVLWLLTWLENPPLFPSWVALRKTRG